MQLTNVSKQASTPIGITSVCVDRPCVLTDDERSAADSALAEMTPELVKLRRAMIAKLN